MAEHRGLCHPDGVVSSHDAPRRHVAEPVEVSQHHVQTPPDEGRGVLREHVCRLRFADDARHLPPKPGARASDARPPAGNADVLTGEAPCHHVYGAGIRAAVQRAHVVVERDSGHPVREHAARVRLHLDGGDGGPAEQVRAAEDAATGPGEERELRGHPCSIVHWCQ